MKRAFAVRGILIVSLAAAGCGLATDGGNDGGSGSGFKDELRFGTGIDYAGMKVTGEATSFDRSVGSISFRFESAANFDGRFVRFYLNGLDQKDFSACASKDAHICLSSFGVPNPGVYEVKAYLVQTVIDIGKETLVTTATLTVR